MGDSIVSLAFVLQSGKYAWLSCISGGWSLASHRVNLGSIQVQSLCDFW